MNRFLPLTFLVVLALTSVTIAQTCSDWSQGIGVPSYYPGIQGDMCLLEGLTCFVAGAELLVVDVADPAAATVRGSIPLPNVPLHMLFRGGFLYLVLDGYGLVEVDVSDPTTPFISRSFTAVPGLIRVADQDAFLITLDDKSVLHVLDVGQGGPITEMASQASPVQAVEIGRMSSFLAVLSEASDEMVSMAFEPSGVGIELDRKFTGSSSHAEFTGDAVYSYEVFQDGDFGDWWLWLQLWDVDNSGILSSTVAECDLHCTRLAAGGGLVFTYMDVGRFSRRPSSLRDPRGYIKLADLEIGLLKWAAMNESRLCLLDGSGSLFVVGFSSPFEMRPSCLFGVSPEEFGVAEAFDGQSCGLTWMEIRGIDTPYYNVRENRYRCFDLVDPLSPREWHSGTFFEGNDQNAELRLLDDSLFEIEKWMDDFYSPDWEIRSVNDGEVISTFTSGLSADYQVLGVYGNALWVFKADFGSTPDSTFIQAYNFNEEGSFFPPVDIPTETWNQKVIGCERDVVCLQDAGVFQLVIFSDPDSLVVLKEIPLPGPRSHSGLWVGRRYYFSVDSKVFSVDFSGRSGSGPTLLLEDQGTVLNLRILGSTLLVGSRDSISLSYYWRLATIMDDGTGSWSSPSMPGSVQNCAMAGNHLYLNGGNGLQGYDISDPAYPRYLGSRLAEPSAVVIQGDYVISGNRVYPLDCNYRNEPFEITAFAFPGYEPGPVDCADPPGEIMVMVPTTPEFEALRLDHETVVFGPGQATEVHRDRFGLVRHEKDRDLDGDLDQVFHFRTKETGLRCTDTQAVLTGRTFDNLDVVATVIMPSVDSYTKDMAQPLGADLYPNPFNPLTELHLTLGQPDKVTVAVYDVKGRMVVRLQDGFLPAGKHDITWQGEDSGARPVPAGVYFFQIATPSESLVRRAVLVR